MAIKLEDVAKEAGVSVTTVSRVINNYGSLSKKTIKKVNDAIKKLDYQPNPLARSLQGKGTQLVGIIFPTTSNPFYGELIEKIEEKLFEKDYKVILCNSENNSEKEKSYLRMLTSNKVDGIIAGAHNLDIKEYSDIKLPIISFDRFLAEHIPIVSSDNYQGGYLATEYLYLHGGRNIAILTGSNQSSSPTNDRLNGYLDFINEQKLESTIYKFNPKWKSSTLKKMEIKTILENDIIDSIFCTDDLTAIMVYNTCKKLKISIPEDIRIIGYDGTDFFQNYFPDLPTIAQPITDIADLLVDLLILKIEKSQEQIETKYTLPVQLLQGTFT